MRRKVLAMAAIAAAAISLVLVWRPGLPHQAAAGGKPATSASPEVLLELRWGTGLHNVGKMHADEAAAVGPMSFTLAPSGAIHVLDQVNLRVLVFEPGAPAPSEIPIGSDAYQDIEVGPAGEIVLLDRLVRSEVVVLDRHGNELGSASVVGPGIAEGGGVTAMLLASDGLWLEYGHERSVRVMDGSLAPCQRQVRPGRVLGDGTRSVVASLVKPAGALLRIVDATGSTLHEQTLQPGQHIHRIAWIETDGAGNVHCMLHLAPMPGPAPLAERTLGLKLGAGLERLGSFESPFVIGQWEQFREFRVAADGTVYQMALTDTGARLLAWRYGP